MSDFEIQELARLVTIYDRACGDAGNAPVITVEHMDAVRRAGDAVLDYLEIEPILAAFRERDDLRRAEIGPLAAFQNSPARAGDPGPEVLTEPVLRNWQQPEIERVMAMHDQSGAFTEPNSRSNQRRLAIQRGEPTPTFSERESVVADGERRQAEATAACEHCDGEGWVWRNELPDTSDWDGSADDTKYTCPYCRIDDEPGELP